jgi:probable phosphoglycerate mutase
VQVLPGSFRFPGGESFVEMQNRMVEAIDRLADRHRGGSFVAVSHADTIKAAVAATAGIPIDLFQRLVVSPCSVTALMRGENSNHVLSVNNTSSLAELALS